jgi:hypothetical protein
MYVCDQETLKREAKGPSWTTSASEKKKDIVIIKDLNLSQQMDTIYPYRVIGRVR